MVSPNTNPQQLETKWKPPDHGVIKINSDAAICGNNTVGLGGIMRDKVGDVVASTCLCLRGKYDVDVAEALALRHALNISLDLGFRKVCLETDCLKLHSHLSKGNAPSTVIGMVVNDIIQLARGCHSCSFSFVKRSGNCVAHELAKLSSSFVELRVLMEEVPSGISSFVMADLASSFE
uniref:RNase H type-1 domain-containing protein n=1 Tax=Chenopodium quinoa TaxID=63459 RepID=A0A803MB59_CHEQI